MCRRRVTVIISPFLSVCTGCGWSRTDYLRMHALQLESQRYLLKVPLAIHTRGQGVRE